MNLDWIPDAQLDAYFDALAAEDQAVCDHMDYVERERLYFGQFSGETLYQPEIDMTEAYESLMRMRKSLARLELSDFE